MLPTCVFFIYGPTPCSSPSPAASPRSSPPPAPWPTPASVPPSSSPAPAAGGGSLRRPRVLVDGAPVSRRPPGGLGRGLVLLPLGPAGLAGLFQQVWVLETNLQTEGNLNVISTFYSKVLHANRIGKQPKNVISVKLHFRGPLYATRHKTTSPATPRG